MFWIPLLFCWFVIFYTYTVNEWFDFRCFKNYDTHFLKVNVVWILEVLVLCIKFPIVLHFISFFNVIFWNSTLFEWINFLLLEILFWVTIFMFLFFLANIYVVLLRSLRSVGIQITIKCEKKKKKDDLQTRTLFLLHEKIRCRISLL